MTSLGHGTCGAQQSPPPSSSHRPRGPDDMAARDYAQRCYGEATIGVRVQSGYLLRSPAIKSRPDLLSCLDDFLGILYALEFAARYGFADRPSEPIEIGVVERRASQFARGELRGSGKWLAGFHFNGALFRIAAVSHRLLRSIRNDPRHLQALIQESKTDFQRWIGKEWSSASIEAIYEEVNRIKHQPEGLYQSREIGYRDALTAPDELLTLLEAWSVHSGKSPPI